MEEGTVQELAEILAPGVTLTLVAISGAAFMMGSSARQGYEDEHPQHRVTVAPFWLARDLITQAQWQAVMGKVPLCRNVGPARPVDTVSWDAAQQFCRRLAKLTGRPYRLPTEAEWEYACRAGSTTAFNTGPTLSTDQANYNGTFSYGGAPGVYRHVTTEAGTFLPNDFGVRDMHGNLWEWCADAWHDDYEGAPADGRAWEAGGTASYRVVRGGSWHDTPDVCRSAARLRALAAEGDDILGFRVALSRETS
jgi:formylglycine-generating enzyme required for sulfatase activity